MNLFQKLIAILERALHTRAEQWKGAPFVHPGQEAIAAATANALITTGIEGAAAMAPSVVENALKIHPDQLKGAPGISDHQAAADFINNHVASALETAAGQ